MSSTVPGSNVAPISFPGIASGIDYNAIIQKLTSLQLSQNTIYNTKITGLASANAELVKINTLFASVQNSLTAISQPNLFNAVSATASNPSVLTATSNPLVTATPGTYQILATHLATASSVTSSTTYGHSELDLIAGSPAATHVLNASYTQITPSNGDASKGPASVTIDGQKISYDVTSQSLNLILANIQSAVQAVDPGFTAGLNPGTDTVVFASTDKPITVGSASDNGNILQVLKLDQAQLVNTGTSGLITAVAGVGGVNEFQVFNYTNQFAQSTDANYVAPVTSGTFTINGVTFNVDNTKDALSDVIKRINASSAGVTASFNQETGQITLANTGTGPQSITLSDGTSNFLTASGLIGAGSSSTIGQQASITVTTPGGTTSTIYGNSNTISTAVPGINIQILQTTAVPSTLTVASDSSGLVSAINTFIGAYNAAINEINTATAAPTIIAAPVGSLNSQAQSVGGGVLYGNGDVAGIKDALTNIISGLSGSSLGNKNSIFANTSSPTGYNSFASIGINLDNSFSIIAPSGNGNSQGQFTQQSLSGTDGAIALLSATDSNTGLTGLQTLQAALAANPNQVQSLFTSTTGIVATLGTYLTGVTGQPTNLSFGLVGTPPTTSVLQAFENSNSDQITSLQQQVQLVTDSANQYADQLRKQFSSYESQIAGYQSLQSQLAGFFKNG